MPDILTRLLSFGQLLQGNNSGSGDIHLLTFSDIQTNEKLLTALPHKVHVDTMFWVSSQIASGQSLITMKSVHADSYDLWHQHLGHPSMQVFEKFKVNSENFPSIRVPKDTGICEGCAKGKMHSHSFSENTLCTDQIFQRIHSDLREYPVLSYR